MKQTRKLTVDFSKLSWGALRRYQYMKKIKEDPEKPIKTKEDLVELLEEHFYNMTQPDMNKLMSSFTKLKKDDKTEQNYNLRKTRGTGGWP